MNQSAGSLAEKYIESHFEAWSVALPQVPIGYAIRNSAWNRAWDRELGAKLGNRELGIELEAELEIKLKPSEGLKLPNDRKID